MRSFLDVADLGKCVIEPMNYATIRLVEIHDDHLPSRDEAQKPAW